MLDDADRVWNRAALFWETEDKDRLPGDLALKSVLMAHGMVMNGGVTHCHESLEPGTVDEAIAGYRWFGLGDVADLLESTGAHCRSNDLDEAASLAADDSYNQFVPADEVIASAFRERLRTTPEAFAAPPSRLNE